MSPVAAQIRCYQCDKPFSRRSDLGRHVRTVHEGHRPYSCVWPECGQVFGSSSALKTHENTHLKVRPHKCACGRAFGDPSALSRHKREFHAPGFNCPMTHCGKIIKRRTEFIRHLKRHGIDPDTVPSVTASKGRHCRRVSLKVEPVDHPLLAFDSATTCCLSPTTSFEGLFTLMETVDHPLLSSDSATTTQCPSPADSFNSTTTLVDDPVEELLAKAQDKLLQPEFDSCQTQAWSDSRSTSFDWSQDPSNHHHYEKPLYPQIFLPYTEEQGLDQFYSQLQLMSQTLPSYPYDTVSLDWSQELSNQHHITPFSPQDALSYTDGQYFDHLYLQPQPQVPLSRPYDAEYSCLVQPSSHASLHYLDALPAGFYPEFGTGWGMQALDYTNSSYYLDAY